MLSKALLLNRVKSVTTKEKQQYFSKHEEVAFLLDGLGKSRFKWFFLGCKSVLWWQWRRGTCTHTDVRGEGDSWGQEFNGTSLWRGLGYFGLKSALIIHKLVSLWQVGPKIVTDQTLVWSVVVKPTSRPVKVSGELCKAQGRVNAAFRRRQVQAMVKARFEMMLLSRFQLLISSGHPSQ